MADGELHDEDLSSCIEQSECPSKNTEAIINSDNIVHQQQEQSVPQADEHENNVQVITNATTSIDTSKHDSNHATAPGEACDDECRELKEKCTIESIPNESDERMSTDVTDSETKTEKAPDSWHILADNLKLLVSSYKEFDSNNYLRGCKWAPDGSCLLTCSNDNKMRLYNLPSELYSGVVDDLPEMTPVLSMQQGESVYDFCWYPKMSSWEPNTCCFITTCKDHPVHLWDAFYHHKRASYVAYNHVDEVTSPHSVCFSLDGERIYAGFNKCIRVFNTSRPGREYNTMATYEKKYGGQTGIISCIAMNPAIPGMFALGSYSCSVGLYDDGICGTTMLLSGVHSGVTHMVFSRDGNYLFIGYRKNGKILCWDLRSPDIVLSTMEREVNTNQRVYFDLYSSERYLISGSTSGHVYGWSLDCTTESDVVTSNEDAIIQPSCLKSVAHTDSVNGCSVHPSLPLLATCSGQRTFHLPNSGSDESSESEGEDKMELDSVRTENSIKIWSLLGASNCGSYEEIRKHL